METRRHPRIVGRLLTAVLIVSAGYSYAQFARDSYGGFGALRGEQGDAAEIPPAHLPDRDLAGCHILYTSVRRENNGSGWRTDYPWGQRNLLTRLSEMTKTRVSRPEGGGPPHVWLVPLTDPALFECPFLMASDVGTIRLSNEEARALRLYLTKGGFLWVDDFWGDAAWETWSSEFAKAMPPTEYRIEEVPLDDPIFRSMLEVKKVPQVSGIGYWRSHNGATSERGEESAVPHFRAIRDRHGRIIAVMTHNTDVTNSWERETDDPRYFYQFSIDGYALGIDVLLYAMTH